MKKLITLATVVSMSLATIAGNSVYQGKDYKDWGKLKLVGNQLSSKDGDPVQLKGWSTFSLHYGEVQGCLGAGQWNLMKQYGANIVRLAMYIDEANSYLSNPAKFKSLVKESIAECKELDMYVLVDWHLLETNGYSGDPNHHLNESKDFFAEISKYCAENGYDNVLYELCNEPTCGWANVKTYAEEVIPVITANQEDAIIVVGTDQWCQKIMEPVTNPIDVEYKKNVMYSFHYYACSHFNFLGDFRTAQKFIPVFVSEWSAVRFDGDGPFCADYADQMIAYCDNESLAPQVVSWCIWNWGKKDEASSFFTDSCMPGSESQYKASDSSLNYGQYVRSLMGGSVPCIPIPGASCDGEGEVDFKWSTLNKIPTTPSAAWHWDYFNLGGEGVAYHDGNGGAWVKDDEGAVLEYSNQGEEVDVFSLAYDMKWINTKCPWSTVENGRVVKWDTTINTTAWKDSKGNPTYKSLNGGRAYSGTDGSCRPDDGVDLSGASCLGTDYANSGYCNLGWVEDGEWITYTVKVAKPGYYKISGIIGAEYKALVQSGEISIVSVYGNHLRLPSNLIDDKAVTAFGFEKTTACADTSASVAKPWNCWKLSDAKSGKNKEIYCAFGYEGEQTITFIMNGDAGGVGPLTFDFVQDIDPNDPILSDVNSVNADVINFAIYPNPTSGEFTVSLANDVEAVVEIVNMAGQVVASQMIEGTATINKALPAGVYTVVVKSEGAVGTQKLIVK